MNRRLICLLTWLSVELTTITNHVSAESTTTPSRSTFDPCYNYSVINDTWRSISTTPGNHDDSFIEWNGWYRLYLQGSSAQIPEECGYWSCGGYTPLVLGGSHPLLQDGVVTRDIYGLNNYVGFWEHCKYYRSNPVQVKACPGRYYVYQLVKPNASIPTPTYCAVAFSQPSYDPCNNYTLLDQPWRATNETSLGYCDNNFNWNGWYRLLYYGMNIQMPESCVNYMSCGTPVPLWLNGPHPHVEDGEVTRQVCWSYVFGCCNWFNSIRVKACQGNYYVYEFVKTGACGAAYCADVKSIATITTLTTAAMETHSVMELTRTTSAADTTHTTAVTASEIPDPSATSGNTESTSTAPAADTTRTTAVTASEIPESSATSGKTESTRTASAADTTRTTAVTASEIPESSATSGKTVLNITMTEECQGSVSVDCGKLLLEKMLNVTVTELKPETVNYVLDMMFTTAEKLNSVTNDSDSLTSYGNSLLKITEKLVSALVNQVETNYTIHISPNGLDIEVFAVGPNTSLKETPQLTVNNSQLDINLIKISQNNKGSAAVAFMSYSSLSNFLKPSFFNTAGNTLNTMMSTVVSATLIKTTNTHLTEPVNLTLKHNQDLHPNGTLFCVYWSETEWVVDGCTLIRTNNSHSVCSCVHLSTFSLIMQNDPPTGDNSDRLLDLLNTVSVAVGLVFLSLALVTFALFRGNSRVTNPALINLCINLLLAHLLFLLTQHFLEDVRPKKLVCAALAGVLHFLFLSAFVWMFLEALILFITIKNLSNIRLRKRELLSWKYLIVIGYGATLVLVGVAAGLVPNGYGNDNCWLKVDRGFIWSFLGPVCFILASNLILFGLIFISLEFTLKQLNSDTSHIKQTRTIVFKTLAQFIILGCPWILGFFTSSSKVVEILFLVLNSQQGTFIFLVHCVFNQEVRSKCRTLGRAQSVENVMTKIE